MRVETSGVKSYKDLDQRVKPLPGYYHVVLKDAIERPQEAPDAVALDFEVLAGTTPGQEKREIRDYISGNAMFRLQRFGMVLGLIGSDQDGDVDFRHAIGRQVIVEVIDDTFTDSSGRSKTKRKLAPTGIWPIGDPDMHDVPIDKGALNMVPAPAAAPAAAAPVAAAPVAAAQVAAAPAAPLPAASAPVASAPVSSVQQPAAKDAGWNNI